MKLYFPNFIGWIASPKDSGKFWTMDTAEPEKLRSQISHMLLRRRKSEDAKLLGEYWMVISGATGLFHFKERHSPNFLKKMLNKGEPDERTVYYHHVLEAKIVFGD